MLTVRNATLAVVILVTAMSPFVFGQQDRASSRTPKADDDYVADRGFKNKIFQIKYRDPNRLFGAIQALGSGFKGATMSVDRDLKTIAVRDFPENIAIIEEAIKRLDTPESPRPDVELRVDILVASNTATAANDYPAELNDVVKQLLSTFKYKGYSVMASAIHSTNGGRSKVSNRGIAETKFFNTNTPQNNPTVYNYSLLDVSLETSTSGGVTLQIGSFVFSMDTTIFGRYEHIEFITPVSIREGEKVVVGTTTIGDNGVIVVLSARALK